VDVILISLLFHSDAADGLSNLHLKTEKFQYPSNVQKSKVDTSSVDNIVVPTTSTTEVKLDAKG